MLNSMGRSTADRSCYTHYCCQCHRDRVCWPMLLLMVRMRLCSVVVIFDLLHLPLHNWRILLFCVPVVCTRAERPHATAVCQLPALFSLWRAVPHNHCCCHKCERRMHRWRSLCWRVNRWRDAVWTVQCAGSGRSSCCHSCVSRAWQPPRHCHCH